MFNNQIYSLAVAAKVIPAWDFCSFPFVCSEVSDKDWVGQLPVCSDICKEKQSETETASFYMAQPFVLFKYKHF